MDCTLSHRAHGFSKALRLLRPKLSGNSCNCSTVAVAAERIPVFVAGLGAVAMATRVWAQASHACWTGDQKMFGQSEQLSGHWLQIRCLVSCVTRLVSLETPETLQQPHTLDSLDVVYSVVAAEPCLRPWPHPHVQKRGSWGPDVLLACQRHAVPAR